MVNNMNSFKILRGRPLGKTLRSRLRCEDNIGMDLKEIGINVRKWVDIQPWIVIIGRPL